MTGESSSPPTTSNARVKRVSAQHTLERVRNNQRRHRARRRDQLASLEEKLKEAESTIASLKQQVSLLRDELKGCRSQPGTACNSPENPSPQHRPDSLGGDSGQQELCAGNPRTGSLELSADESAERGGVLEAMPTLAPFGVNPLSPTTPDVVDIVATETMPPDEALFSIINSSESTAAMQGMTPIFPPQPQQEREITLLDAGHNSSVATQIMPPATDAEVDLGQSIALPWLQDLSLTFPTPISHDIPALTSNIAPRAPLQGLSNFVGTGVSFRAISDGESTILCSEAYILISQQNFKGVSQSDVDAWLCDGFRNSCKPGEGCRVRTDLLLSLIGFISDAWSAGLMDLA